MQSGFRTTSCSKLLESNTFRIGSLRSKNIVIEARASPGRQFNASPGSCQTGSGFLEAVADTVQGLDHVEVVVGDLELLAQPLDVAVDGAIVDIDLVVIGCVHQRVAAFHHAGPG